MPHAVRVWIPVLLACLAPGLSWAQVGPNPAKLDCVDRMGDVAVRWDGDTGTFASLRWSEPAEALLGPSMEQAVCRWLEQDLAPLLDVGVLVVADEGLVPPSGPALVHVATRDLGNGRVRVDLEQRVAGVRVLAAGLQVEVEQAPDGPCPVAVRGRYYPAVGGDLGLPSAQVEAELAERFASFATDGLRAETRWEQVVVPSEGGFRLAFAVETAPSSSTAFRVFVDAETGEELSRTKLCCEATARGLAYDKNPGETPRAAVPLTDLYVFQGNDRVTTNDKGEHALTGMVSLDEGLSGPLLRMFISNENELTYTGPADILLNPSEGLNDQDELAAWHHMVSFNRHLQQTYARFKDSQAATTRFAVVVRFKRDGQPLANAFFSPQNVQAGGDSFTGYIGMGTFGAREAARSSSVIQHEYCHALFSEIVQLSGSVQAGGLGEGLSDYLPSAFKDDPLVGGWLVNPSIRDLRRDFVWPQDNNNEVHRVGHIFVGALWDARETAAQGDPADRHLIDQAVVEGIFRLRDQPTLIDAREAILAGDEVANGGAFRVTLTTAFAEHGIGPAAQNDGPTVAAVTSGTVRVGDTLTFVVVADDPDGDPVTVSPSALENSSFDPVTGEFSFFPAAGQEGAHQVTFTASDEVLFESETISLTVLPALPPPPPPTNGGVAPLNSGVAPVGSDAGRSSGGGGGGCELGMQAQGTPGGLLILLILGLLVTARSQAKVSRS